VTQRAQSRGDFIFVLAASIALALASFSIPWMLSPHDPPIVVAAFLTVAWLVLLLFALARYRWRGLWLLVGAPAALFLPALVLLLFIGCSINSSQCP
jgi:predicted membrane channel-forming protein YqfA (hemolysin III family)